VNNRSTSASLWSSASPMTFPLSVALLDDTAHT
jgi:hypothetical protein